MSFIWNVMLSFSDDEFWGEDEDEDLEIPPALEAINGWLEADEVRNYGPLTDLTVESGGAGMSAPLYGGGFKRFDIEAFIGVVAAQEWQDRDNVQLFVRDEESAAWSLVNLDQEKSGSGGS